MALAGWTVLLSQIMRCQIGYPTWRLAQSA